MAGKPDSIRIVCDGSPGGTKVFDAVSGAQLHGVTKVTFSHSVLDKKGNRAVPVATVDFICPAIEAGNVKVTPIPGRVDRILRKVLRRK